MQQVDDVHRPARVVCRSAQVASRRARLRFSSAVSWTYLEGRATPGSDELRVGRLQDFYLAESIITRASPIKDLYSNEFILCAECVPTLAGSPAPHSTSTFGEAKLQMSTRSVYFDFDSAQLKADYRQALQEHARYLASHPSVKVQLVGYTDLIGHPEHNRTLGQRRAEAVKGALVAAGVNETQISVVSAGADPRTATPKGATTPWLNRRADIIYSCWSGRGPFGEMFTAVRPPMTRETIQGDAYSASLSTARRTDMLAMLPRAIASASDSTLWRAAPRTA